MTGNSESKELHESFKDGIRRSTQLVKAVSKETPVPGSCKYCLIAFLVRAINRFQAAYLLWQDEFYEEAAVIIRTIYELALQAHYMAHAPKARAKAFCDHPARTEQDRERHHKPMIQNWWGKKTRRKLAATVDKELGKRRRKDLHGEGPFLCFYDQLYSPLSKLVHSDPQLVTEAIDAIDRETRRGPLVNPDTEGALRDCLPELATNQLDYVMAAVARVCGIEKPPIHTTVWGILK